MHSNQNFLKNREHPRTAYIQRICPNVCVCVCAGCLLAARVQGLESHGLRGFLPAWIPKAWHAVSTQKLFDEWKDGFKFSPQSSKQVPPSPGKKGICQSPSVANPGLSSVLGTRPFVVQQAKAFRVRPKASFSARGLKPGRGWGGARAIRRAPKVNQRRPFCWCPRR